MKRRRATKMEERDLEQLVARLGGEVTPPDEADLRAMAREASTTARPAPRVRPARLRGAVAVGLALVAGSVLGFGLSAWNTDEGIAGSRFVGLGFLPAKGWTVIQSQARGPTAATAIAANVALDADDPPGSVPYATLSDLPERGVVVVGTFTLRGEPTNDSQFRVRVLPLKFADADEASVSDDPLLSDVRLTGFRLRAAVGAYNVDVRIYFGGRPSPPTVAAAQRQLNRLFVASDRITIATQERVLRRHQTFVTLFGSVASRRSGEPVTIEAKECGPHAPVFRPWGLTEHTRQGGGWSTAAHVMTTTAFRAAWSGSVSTAVTVWARAGVFLQPGASPRQFEVRVGGVANFWRKRVEVQAYDPRLGAWTTFRSVVLTESRGLYSAARFTMSPPPGKLVRAFFPLSQARPCYLAGYSNVLRT